METMSALVKTRGKKTFSFRLSEPQLTAIWFLLPAVLIFGIFVVWPIVQSARYSFYDWNGIQPRSNYIGLDNYRQLSEDPIFWRALRHNIVVVLWSVGTQIPLGIGLALLLTRGLKGSSVFRTLYFAPMVLSEVIVGMVWRWIYHPKFGMANALMDRLGLPTQAWLGDESLTLFCILIATTWRYIGFYIVIFIAAIQGIPDELYEAASIDGANGWQKHQSITLPLLVPTIRISSVLMIVGALKSFDLVWVLTEGGPSHASELIATYMFKEAFRSTHWGYGSALAFVLFLIAFVVALVFIVVTRERTPDNA